MNILKKALEASEIKEAAAQVSMSKLNKAVDGGMEAFFKEIAKEFPEIKSGDFSPHDHQALAQAMFKAAKTWVETNS